MVFLSNVLVYAWIQHIIKSIFQKYLVHLESQSSKMDNTAAGASATAGNPNESPGTAGGGTSNSSWRYQSRQQGGRGGFRKPQYPRQHNTAALKPSNQTLFKERWPKLEGFIFDVGPHQASIYSKTKVEIVQYSGRTYSAEARVATSKLEGQEAKFRNTHVQGADTVAEIKLPKFMQGLHSCS